MSSIKLKFYKTAPNLFISKLRPIAREYNEERVYTFGFDEAKTTVLEEILPEVASERFFNVLYKELNCRLNFGSEYTPDSIKRNQKIVDLAIKHDPGAALDMLDEMLTEEHLRILEEHLSSDGRVFTYITKIPAKFTKSEIILDYYLKQVFENDHRMQVVDRDIFEIIRAYLNEPDKVKKILNRTEEYYKTHDAYLTATRAYGFDRIFENQDVLEFFLKRNNLYLEYLSGPTLDRGLKIIADKIIDGTFDYGAYNASYFNVLYDSNIIINAILKTNQIEKYKIILARSNVTSFNYIQLTSLFEYNLTAPEPLFPDEWEKSTDFLHIYLTNPELRPKNIRFNQFKKEAFDETNIRFICQNMKEFGISRAIEIIYYLDTNPDILDAYINFVCENFDEIKATTGLSPFSAISSPESLREESMDKIIAKLKELSELPEPIKTPLGYELLSNERFVSKIIKAELKGYYSGITQRIFLQPEVLNTVFRTFDYDVFINDNRISTELRRLYDLIEFTSAEDFKKQFVRLNHKFNPSLALLLIRKYQSSTIIDEDLDELCEMFLEMTKNSLHERFPDCSENVNIYIENVLEGKRSPFTAINMHTKAQLTVAANYTDIFNPQVQSKITDELNYVYENANKKHIREIMELLIPIGFESFEAFEIAIKMYASIGYNRTKDILNPNPNKNYGPVDIIKIRTIFSNIDLTSIPLVKKGKQYVFRENEFLINLLMGSNYKDKTTIIHQYLTSHKDKHDELLSKKMLIENDPNLSEEEKTQRINDLQAEFDAHINEINTFISRFDNTFNHWDIIEEEFVKAQAKSKIKLKLNMSYINSTSGVVREQRKKPALEPRDFLLEKSDVFEYVGYDTQYTAFPEKAPARAIELSRRMDYVQTKKFPNIKLEQDGYQLFVYEPHDRRILSAGYRSGCCFRPNGNADNHGKDNSLLNYCASTEYGGGVEIKNQAGETVMFSPLLRNGNVLMVHSIETKHSSNPNTMKAVHELLSKFATKTIEVAKEQGDEIDFVSITSLHYLDPSYTKGTIPVEKAFAVYDEESKYSGMYTNLNAAQMILDHSPGKTIGDISYGSVDISYEYPTVNYYFVNQFTDDEREIVTLMRELQDKITDLSNQRHLAKKNQNHELANVLLMEIKAAKSEYLKFYKKSLEFRKGIDIYNQYNDSRTTIASINEKLGINFEIEISELINGVDWYVIITPQNKVIANALPSGEQKLKEELEKLEKLRGTLEYHSFEEPTQSITM